MNKEDTKEITGVTYKKSTVDSYSMHFNGEDHRRCLWAICNIDSEHWAFSATSDCGDFSYRWSPEDHRTFKELLVILDKSYFLSKISDENVVDDKESIKRMKEYVLELRKDGSLDKDEAREKFDKIQDIESGNYDDDFEHAVYYELGWDYLDCIVKVYPNSAIAFYDIVFKNLKKILRKELKSV